MLAGAPPPPYPNDATDTSSLMGIIPEVSVFNLPEMYRLGWATPQEAASAQLLQGQTVNFTIAAQSRSASQGLRIVPDW